MRKYLDLVLKGKWYDMIASGEKREEYREIKPYWVKRLLEILDEDTDPRDLTCKESRNYFTKALSDAFNISTGALKWDLDVSGALDFKKIAYIRFHRGYSNTTMLFKCEGITIGRGNPAWGAPEEEVFIIKLGNKI